jgi:hypothetical protein
MRGIKINDLQIRETGILFGIISILMGLYSADKYWFVAAIGILMVTLLIPSLLKPLAWGWFGLSRLLGWFTSRIVLLVIFWGLVTPIGLIRRAFGKDPLRLHLFKKGDNSAFVVRNHEFSASDLKYPF